MTGLISQIVEDASNEEVGVSELLRKAIVASSRLNLTELRDWLQKEINGYNPADKIPSYRNLKGRPLYFNPYNGWQPLIFESVREEEIFSSRLIYQSISELDTLVKKDRHDSSLGSPYSGEALQRICRGLGFAASARLDISVTELIKVLTAVRNQILNWALELEQKGVLGEGMHFSEKEKEIAQNTNVTNITNHIGSLTNSQLQQGTSYSSQSYNASLDKELVASFIAELETSKQRLDLSSSDNIHVDANLHTLKSQIRTSEPNPVIISEALKSIRNVLEGITGSVIASGLLTSLATLLP